MAAGLSTCTHTVKDGYCWVLRVSPIPYLGSEICQDSDEVISLSIVFFSVFLFFLPLPPINPPLRSTADCPRGVEE